MTKRRKRIKPQRGHAMVLSKKRSWGLLLFISTFLFGNATQAAPEIEVNLNPSRAVKVKGSCELVIQVSWPSEEGDFHFSEPKLMLENLAVKKRGESNEVFHRNGKEWKKKTSRLTLNALEPGRGRIQPFQVRYLEPATQRGGHFEVGAMEIQIKLDRTPLYRGIGLASVILGGGFGGAWFLRQRIRKRKRDLESQESQVEDRYLSQLMPFKEELTSQGMNHTQIFEMGRIFRSYLSEKYSTPGLQVTSHEILEKISDRVPSDERKLLKGIFQKLDAGRYEDPQKSVPSRRALYQEIFRYIEGKKII